MTTSGSSNPVEGSVAPDADEAALRPSETSRVGASSAPLGSLLPRQGEPHFSQRPLSFGPPLSLVPSEAPPGVDPVHSVPAQSVPPSEMSNLERELVRQLRTGRAALPLLPQVAESALRLANDPEARIDQLARLVDTDPPIAARFMSVANSVAYWRGWLTPSTQSAIVRLGLANTRDLLFQAVYAGSTSGLKKFQPAVSRSFTRSVVAAVAARAAAQELKIAGEYDYMCGLLHDIGEARVYRILDGLAPTAAEANLVKYLVQKYHCVAGAEIAMAWKLPTEIVDACAAHHDASSVESPHVRLVMIADLIVAVLEAQASGKASSVTAAEHLGVGQEQFRALIDKTRAGVGNRTSKYP